MKALPVVLELLPIVEFLYPDLSGSIMVWPGCPSVRPSVRPSVCLSVGLSTKLVNTIQTEPFQLGPSNLVHMLLITRGGTLSIVNVMGQRSRSHARYCC